MDASLRPLVPFVDVQVGAADRGDFDFHQHVGGSEAWHHDIANFGTRRGRGLHHRQHRLRHYVFTRNRRIGACKLKILARSPYWAGLPGSSTGGAIDSKSITTPPPKRPAAKLYSAAAIAPEINPIRAYSTGATKTKRKPRPRPEAELAPLENAPTRAAIKKNGTMITAI